MAEHDDVHCSFLSDTNETSQWQQKKQSRADDRSLSLVTTSLRNNHNVYVGSAIWPTDGRYGWETYLVASG